MSEIRVIIADDDVDFASELSDALESHPQVVIDSLVTSPADVIERLAQRPADVVVIDIDLAGFDAREMVAHLARQQPRTKVLLLSAHDDPEARSECLETGAVCLPKDLEPMELLRAVTALASGASLVTPDLQVRTSPRTGDDGRDPEITRTGPVELSPRELVVLGLLAERKSPAEIAGTLSTSDAIVSNHLANLCRKFHVHDTEEIVPEARARGLLA
jgi:two-component system nitrate/nitrite response regulator NarL